MSRTKNPEPPETWHSSADPLQLIRRSRHVGNPRRYLLLGCGIVRRWPGGLHSELGQVVLSALEKEVRPHNAPDRNLAGVLMHRFTSAFQLPPSSTPRNSPVYEPVTPEGRQLLETDAQWVEVFFRHAPTLRSATKALPNLLIPAALAAVYPAAGRTRDEEVKAIREELKVSRERGWIDALLGRKATSPPKQVEIGQAIFARLGVPVPTALTPASCYWNAVGRLLNHHVAGLTAETTAAQCDLIREIFGDPYRPWRPDPAWVAAHDGAARRIAEGIEQTGDFGTMPILGDALEDAGCGDAAALDHYRKRGPHAPVCWVLDLVLGKQ